jgi:hypothetical protein
VAAGIDAAKLADGTVSNAELQYLNGVTSAVQTQIDGKQPLAAALTTLASATAAGLALMDDADAAAQRTTLGLGNVDNTSDANKPVSTAAQTALDTKVTGPASATDNALARFDGTTGKVVQNSTATLTDSGTLTVAAEGAQVTAEGAGGDVLLDASAGVSALIWRFDPGDGQKEVRIAVNESTSEDFTLKLPAAAGTVGQSLSIGSVSAPEVTLEWSTPAGGGDALTTNPLSQFAATTSSQLAGVISDETGSGALVFANSPTLVTPALGTPASGDLTNCTGLPVAGLASFVGLPVSIQLACSDEATALTTGTAKLTFRMPHAMTVTAVRASVGTAPTGSTLVVDINEGGTTILSTELSIDATEKTSTTAATPAVISDTALADDAEITIDIDQIGSTIAGAGLKITLIGTRA